MSIASSVVSVVLKSAVGDRFGSGLFNELAGIAIGEVSDKGINEITDFINEKKSKIDSILSKENLKFLGIPPGLKYYTCFLNRKCVSVILHSFSI